jgi:hypothetical protein
VYEQRWRSGRRQCGGDLATDVPGFAHTGDDHASSCCPDHVDSGGECRPKPILHGGGERGDPARFQFERAQARENQAGRLSRLLTRLWFRHPTQSLPQLDVLPRR